MSACASCSALNTACIQGDTALASRARRPDSTSHPPRKYPPGNAKICKVSGATIHVPAFPDDMAAHYHIQVGLHQWNANPAQRRPHAPVGKPGPPASWQVVLMESSSVLQITRILLRGAGRAEASREPASMARLQTVLTYPEATATPVQQQRGGPPHTRTQPG